MITADFINALRFSQPETYQVDITFVVPHGRGFVVGYTTIIPPHDGMPSKTEHRCAGFVRHKHAQDGILCKFDMTIDLSNTK